jgi:hypothetical protein
MSLPNGAGLNKSDPSLAQERKHQGFAAFIGMNQKQAFIVETNEREGFAACIPFWRSLFEFL